MTDVPLHASLRRVTDPLRRLGPGLLVCATVALAAQFLSDHYGAPALLMALLLGIAFHFLATEGRAAAGIGFAAAACCASAWRCSAPG